MDSSGEFPYLTDSSVIHYDTEVAVMLKSGGDNISMEEALDHVSGYALSLDITRRDFQAAQRKLGRPWEIGKAFERSAPVGPIHQVENVGNLQSRLINLKVNGVLK